MERSRLPLFVGSRCGVPAQIAQYVSGHYPDASIVQIDRDKHDYEVKLSNGLELTFDLKFNLIDIDD